jgi:DNA-binding PadR family transcriptional regulator
MSLKFGLLGLLNYGSMTGYDLSKAFNDSLSFFWQAKTSQIYKELEGMERNGWLTSEIVYQTEKPNRKVYSITENGRKALVEWLASPESAIRGAFTLKSEFLMRIFFAGEQSPEQIYAIISAFKAASEEALANLGAIGGSIRAYRKKIPRPERSLYWNMTALFGKEYCKACIRWAKKAMKTLEKRIEKKKNAAQGSKKGNTLI